MTREEYTYLFHRAQLNLVAFRKVYECDIEIMKMVEMAVAAERDSMTKDGWRRCAVGQKTTQFCGMLEDAVKAEREACARIAEIKLVDGPRAIAAAIRARGEK